MPESTILLAIDTCGPTGSVALGRLSGQVVDILGQIELEGRNYSATLVAAVAELLAQSHVNMGEVGAIVVVNGPGSFTGVRVGLAAVKGLAEAAQTPVAAVSRLEVLAAISGVTSAALDAHRHEVYLRVDEEGRVPQVRGPHGQVFVRGVEVPSLGPGKSQTSNGSSPTELLAGANELTSISPAPKQIAFCDEAAALVLALAWSATELIRTAPPTAADALALCGPRVAAGEFVDLGLLDGHYLRRSDAEIFGTETVGEPSAVVAQRP
jgi:tRNA threonylcarbamoyladenosine biosynthesis protein TsaB